MAACGAGMGLILGLDETSIKGLALGGILCRFIILIAAFFWGSGGGTMAGVMTGILPSVSSSVFAQTLGIYAISGLLAGSFRSFGRLGVIIGFMVGNLALSMFIPETRATISAIWETGIASLLFFFLPESLRTKFPQEMLGFGESGPELIDSHIKEVAQCRIHHLASFLKN